MAKPNPIAFADDAQIQEQAELNARKRIADELMRQGMNQDMQTQMAGNVAIRRSPLEGLAGLAKAYVGKKSAEEADLQQARLAKALQNRISSSLIGSENQANQNGAISYGVSQPQTISQNQYPSNTAFSNLTPEGKQYVKNLLTLGMTDDAVKYMGEQLKPHVTADGRAVALQGGQMLPVAGSLGTYGAFQDVGERSKAGYDVLPRDMWPRSPEGGLQPQTRLGMVGEVQGVQPQVMQSQPYGAQGLDISKLTPQQQQFLMNKNPAAFSRGVQDFQQTQGMPQQAQIQQGIQRQAMQSGMPRYPTPEQQAAANIQAQIQPTANLEYAKGQASDFAKQYSTVQNAGIDASNKVARLDRLSSLISDVETGKLTPVGTNVAAYAQSMGINIDPKLGNKQAAQALMGEMALQLRNPSGGAGMPGAMSDKDREFLQAMSPSLSNTPQGNRLIIETARKLAQRDRDVAALARQYNGGRLDNGFYQVLQQYSDKHPLFPQTQQMQTNQLDSLLNKYAPR